MSRGLTGAGWVPVVGTVTLLLTGCDDDAPDETPNDTEAAETTDLTERPDVSTLLPPDRAEPPEDLEVTTLVPGTGAEARPGSVLTVQYVGMAWSTGEEFAASWDQGQPYTFELGAGQVIPGWDRGLAGMRVGGRSVLTVPPDQAYGDQGSPGRIEPGETLVFVVDLLDVDEPG